MTLQEEMFTLVAAWKSSGLTKKTFIADKPIGLAKFAYWCNKYHTLNGEPDLSALASESSFQELVFNDTSFNAPRKVLDLTTASGLRITVFG